ncbi:MAG: TonB-dependent receptor [Bacteroidetes bacterium]|nr:TonB-dependent receptor [Bacteroidota bacterium]
MKNRFHLICCLVFLLQLSLHGQQLIEGKVTDAESSEALSMASVQLGQSYSQTDENGFFSLSAEYETDEQLIVFFPGYKTVYISGDRLSEQSGAAFLEIKMTPLLLDLEAVEVAAESAGGYSLRRLRNVEGAAIYAGRKTEVVELGNLVANLATNNPRQIYQGIAGLNIWENDGSGLQLNIGARGLNPNRTSNFNTRQNGYDISADALGYPESYYTPPSLALQRIEIVRGAASLQYGPQFGGLLNFVMKKGPADKALQYTTANTVGSFGLLNTFHSLGGSGNGWNYYTFFQHKQGDGWRPNAPFNQQTAYAAIHKEISDNFQIGVEYTFMDYLAQQPGGLQDFEFEQDPRQSKRSRNWFAVNWNLAALKWEYKINDRTRIDNRSFLLHASRNALGELGRINRPDPMRERDLIMGNYDNWGNETRLVHRYDIKGKPTTFLTGIRYYQGLSSSQQGDANDGSGPDFEFLNPQDLERSDYIFPSRNVAAFAENLFNLGQWTVTPGLRFEYIRTASEGYYKHRVFSGGEVIFEQKFDESRENSRHFLLAGLGISRKLGKDLELYGNVSQNYRSINFSDLAISNPNLIVDSLLTDERGYNADLGFRGTAFQNRVRFDLSTFLLQYDNRIGLAEIVVPDPLVIEKVVSFRTNIGKARIVGLESYLEAELMQFIQPGNQDFSIKTSLNLSLLHGRYTRGHSDFKGNEVELIPPLSLKTGLVLGWKKLRLSYLYSYVGAHYSDATNAAFVSDATRGIIPTYSVQDLSICYSWKWLRLQTGINNLADARYFTRRATAYPGPGIIPADGRSFYLTVGMQF